MKLARIILPLVCLALSCACEPVFAPGEPPTDGDASDGDTSDGDTADGDLDAESDSDYDADPEPDDEVLDYNLKLIPDFLRVGDHFEGGSIEFKNVEELRKKLAQASASFPSWQIDFGDDVAFLLVRFDPDDLRFYDIEMLVSATARTGMRQVSARITYGNVTIIEYGEFYVLPELDSQTDLPVE